MATGQTHCRTHAVRLFDYGRSPHSPERFCPVCVRNELATVKADLLVTTALFEERARLLAEIPPCPVHGRECVPHAIEWLRALKHHGPDEVIVERGKRCIPL